MIALLDYGGGNIRSVQNALQRLGVSATLTHDPALVRQADKVIFPGVGAAGPAMLQLRETGLDVLLPQLLQPVLGICLGMQLMCTIPKRAMWLAWASLTRLCCVSRRRARCPTWAGTTAVT